MSKGDPLIIKEVVDNCKETFGGNLVSVVLFGSRAKGTAKEHSDYDFFVIVTNLPESKERDKISLELGRYVGRRYYKSVQIHLTSEKELELEESLNPLFYGILTGYRVLYGKKAWGKILSRWRPTIRKEKPRLIEEDRIWEIARLI